MFTVRRHKFNKDSLSVWGGLGTNLESRTDGERSFERERERETEIERESNRASE